MNIANSQDIAWALSQLKLGQKWREIKSNSNSLIDFCPNFVGVPKPLAEYSTLHHLQTAMSPPLCFCWARTICPAETEGQGHSRLEVMEWALPF